MAKVNVVYKTVLYFQQQVEVPEDQLDNIKQYILDNDKLNFVDEFDSDTTILSYGVAS